LHKLSHLVPLETVFQSIADHGGLEVIQRLVSLLHGCSPGPVHQFAALLAEKGLLSALYTLNFDSLHERAFPNACLVRSASLGRSIVKQLISASGNRVRYVKLHGSHELAGTITLTQYISGLTSSVKRLVWEDLRGKCWLVAGYGGWDLDFQQVFFAAVKRKAVPREVIWVDKTFPLRGGRTDMLHLLSKAGASVVPVSIDVNKLCADVVSSTYIPAPAKEIRRSVHTIAMTLGKAHAAAIVSELSLHSPHIRDADAIIKQASHILSTKQESWILHGRLAERTGRSVEALSSS
jgi:hypothetical protein